MVRARGLAAQLGDGHAMQAGVDASVATAVEAMADGFVVALGRGGGQRGGAVEAGEAALAGEAARVADLDEQFGFGPCRDPAQLLQGRPGLLREAAQLAGSLAILTVELGDGSGVTVQQPKPQRRRPVLAGGMTS